MKALIVDDSRAMRHLLRKMLVDLGFDVSEAEDGLQALERVQEGEAPDIALLDWNMPNMDGLSFLREIRRQAICNTMRIMMVTSVTEMERVREALESGADEYVMKPFTKDALIERLQGMGLLP
ncbi:MAG: response regulator [Planctomycetota bacterium]